MCHGKHGKGGKGGKGDSIFTLNVAWTPGLPIRHYLLIDTLVMAIRDTVRALPKMGWGSRRPMAMVLPVPLRALQHSFLKGEDSAL